MRSNFLTFSFRVLSDFSGADLGSAPNVIGIMEFLALNIKLCVFRTINLASSVKDKMLPQLVVVASFYSHNLLCI